MSLQVADELEATKSGSSYTRQTWGLLLALLLAGMIYGGFYLKRGWIPHDDGSFATAAEHVLNGELPHRDFDDLYTGGLTFLNAAAMQVFGVNLASIRYPAFLLFLLWIPAVFSIARRFVSDYGAALATLLAIALSFPNYSSAVPSWYNLFFATFGIWALLRFFDEGQRHWLLAGGLCAGLSFLAKIAGLYFLAACLLALIYYQQEKDRRSDMPGGATVFGITVAIGCALFCVALLKLVNWSPDPRYLIHFVVPGVALSAALVTREFRSTYTIQSARFQKLTADAFALLIGFAIPISLFLIPYIASHSLHAWIEGVFVLPTKRLTFASREPASLKWVNLLATATLAYALLKARNLKSPLGGWAKFATTTLLTAAVIVSGFQKGTYHFLWFALVLLIPVTTCAIALSARVGAQVFALAATVALCSLVQYPYAAPVYLVYVLPLAVLVWTAYATQEQGYSRLLLVAIALAYLVFFALRVTPSYVNAMGLYATGLKPVTRLGIPRAGGLRLDPVQATVYGDVVATMQQHRRGEFTFAAVDAPEIYFLSGMKSTSRSLFDFFEDTSTRNAHLLDNLESHQVNVIVLKTPEETGLNKLGTPSFSKSLSTHTVELLRLNYPNSRTIGHFEVRWKQ
jgi:hypothetical protein